MKTKSLIALFLASICFYAKAQFYHVNEDFNSGSLPAGWTNTAVTGSTAWSFGIDGSIDFIGDNNIDGTNLAYFDDSGLGSSSTNNRASLTTPSFNNLAYGATFLEFDYNFRHFSASVPDSFIVEVYDGISWVQVFSRDFDDCGRYPLCASFPKANIDITAYKNSSCQVRFIYYDGNDWSWYVGIDNVKITSPLANDIGITALLSPESNCGLNSNEIIQARIFNYGSNSASGFSVSYRINGGVAVTEIVSASIPGGDSLDYTFATTANLSVLGGYLIESYTDYSLDGSNTNDSLKTTVNNSPVYQTNYFEGFDAGLGGWQISGINPSWAAGIPSGTKISATAGGSGSLVTNLSGNYNNTEVSYVTSPCLDFSGLTADPFISFFLNYEMENDSDFFWVDFSIDNGISWSKIPTSANSVNWYSDTTNNYWTDSNSGWAKSESVLSGTSGQSRVKIRFVFSTNWSNSLEGIGIDNFTIKTQSPVDIEMLSVDSPIPLLCGFDSTEIITATIINRGTTSITSFNAGYRVNGGAAVLQNNITPATPIAPNTTYQFSFTQTANMQVTANYLIDVWANTAGDVFLPNDSLINTSVFNTSGTVFATSYKQDFDGFTVGSVFSNTNDAIGGSWTRYSSSTGISDYLWRVGESTANRSGSTGPATDLSGTGYFMYTEASDGVSGDTTILESPCLDLTSLNTAALSFWWHRYGADIGNMFLDIYDGNSWVNSVVTLSTAPQTSSIDAWTEEIVSLSAYVGSRIKIRFRAVSLGCCQGDMAVDNVSISGTLVGISESSDLKSLSVYPNPSIGVFSIKSDFEVRKDYLLQVRDVKGKLIYSEEVNNLSSFELDLSAQSKGIYFLQIRSEQGIFNEKIVIQ